jgi:serine protease Do
MGVGDTARVKVLRDGRQKDLDVKVGKRPLTVAAASDPQQKEKEGEYGFQVTELTPQVAQRYNIKETTGVIVIGVEPNSKAQAAGIQQGDLIIEVNRKNVASVKDFKNLIEQHKKGDGINLLVKRMNGGLMVIHLA